MFYSVTDLFHSMQTSDLYLNSNRMEQIHHKTSASNGTLASASNGTNRPPKRPHRLERPLLWVSICERPLLLHFLSWRRLRVNTTQKCVFFTRMWLGRCKNGVPAANSHIMGINLRTTTFATFSKLASFARKYFAKMRVFYAHAAWSVRK